MVFPDGLDIGCERVESRMTPGLGLTKLMDGVGIHWAEEKVDKYLLGREDKDLVSHLILLHFHQISQ